MTPQITPTGSANPQKPVHYRYTGHTYPQAERSRQAADYRHTRHTFDSDPPVYHPISPLQVSTTGTDRHFRHPFSRVDISMRRYRQTGHTSERGE